MRASKFSNRACLAMFGAVLLHGAATAADFSACIDQSSPTVAADQKLAEAVASAEHASLTLYRFDGTGDREDGFDMRDFARLLAHHCEVVLGFPSGIPAAGLPPSLVATSPYGSTGFVLVTAHGLPGTSLADLPDETEVAVTYGTAPNLYLIQHPKLRPDLHPTDAETIKTLLSGDVKAAMLWHPTLAAAQGTGRFTVHKLEEPSATWNLVGLVTASGKDAKAKFEAAIEELRKSGDLARLLAPYGIDAAPMAQAAPVSTHTETISRNPIIRAAFVKRSEGTTPPAIYTAAQASAGELKFALSCSQCHGIELEGNSGPSLKGPNFASVKADYKVGDVFTIVAGNMPAFEPGSLPHDDYVEIMAYLLQQNGYPAGTTPLRFDTAKTSQVPFIFHPK